MGSVAKPHRAFVFLMVLTLGLSLGLPAEDVLDAVYDESEAVPYEVIPPHSISSSPLSASQLRQRQIPYARKLVFLPGSPQPVSATMTPINAPRHESH
jgi:hypothetical protein